MTVWLAERGMVKEGVTTVVVRQMDTMIGNEKNLQIRYIRGCRGTFGTMTTAIKGEDNETVQFGRQS